MGSKIWKHSPVTQKPPLPGPPVLLKTKFLASLDPPEGSGPRCPRPGESVNGPPSGSGPSPRNPPPLDPHRPDSFSARPGKIGTMMKAFMARSPRAFSCIILVHPRAGPKTPPAPLDPRHCPRRRPLPPSIPPGQCVPPHLHFPAKPCRWFPPPPPPGGWPVPPPPPLLKPVFFMKNSAPPPRRCRDTRFNSLPRRRARHPPKPPTFPQLAANKCQSEKPWPSPKPAQAHRSQPACRGPPPRL